MTRFRSNVKVPDATPAATLAHAASDAARWQALRERNAAADGSFVYGVKTTGVYCRPTCAARLPRRENVSFYTSPRDAERAGFRPCKRCKPEQAPQAERDAALVAKLCRLLERSVAKNEPVPSLEALARAAGKSAFHTHRLFKAITGMTPRAYAASQRAARVRTGLTRRAGVTQTMYDAGFNSSGRFYEKSREILGMAPSVFRAGGRDEVIRFAVGECSLGAILVAATARGVCAISLGDEAEALLHEFEGQFPEAELVGGDRNFEQLVARVVALVEEPGASRELPLDIRGTAFQQRVWQALTKIPLGSTWTYSELARAIGAPRAVRAVASACAANRLAVAIPCHRVVRNDGSLSGYRWGVERKRRLIEREAEP
ncbi:MAG: bifunctional DNA-binding transcriptional regulator/O6-methylguanine-DNA methyltransferase Ada [Myxococcota bacterium]